MPKKIELYNEQRKDIFNKIFQILEINDFLMKFMLEEIN